MIKRIICMLCAVVFAFSTIKTAQALALIEDSAKSSLEITYSKNGNGFKNVEVEIHRVAKLLDDGSYETNAPYSSYPVSIYDVTSKKEWRETALTLDSYIKADKIKAYKTRKTAKDGKVIFSDLETGLYLVCALKAKTDVAEYKFDSFLVYLPLYEQDKPNYNVKIQPKLSEVVKTDKTIEYKIVKLFKDLGYKKHRPQFVKVDILKNGVVEKRIKLSSSNNWVYSFKAKDDGSVWSVVERNVSKKYRVKVAKNKSTFSLTNTYIIDKSNGRGDGWLDADGPSTGDTFPFMFYFVTMLISGMILVIAGVGLMRSNKNE